MKIRNTAAVALLAVGFALAGGAHGQTLYKLTDKNGKVTYAEKVPPGFDGKVQRVDIDPNANRMDAPKAPPAPSESSKGTGEGGKPNAAEGFSRDAQKKQRAQEKLEAAKERLEEARKNLKEAGDNAGDNDFRWLGNAGGGARRIPTEEFAARLTRLDEAVKKAEEAVAEAEKGL